MDSQLQTMLSGQIFLLFSGTSFFIFGLTGLAVAAIRRNSGGGVRAVVFPGIWSTMYGVQRLTECSTLVTIFPGGFSRVFPTSRLQLLTCSSSPLLFRSGNLWSASCARVSQRSP